MWFEVLKNEKIDYSKPEWRNQRLLRPEGTRDPTTRNIEAGNPKDTGKFEDVETGELSEKGLLSTGFSAARERFSEWKSANQKAYYDAIGRVLKIYSGSRTVLPQRNLMETIMGNYWEDHLVILRQTYDRMEEVANETEGDTTKPYLSSKDSDYVTNQIGSFKADDDKALVG